jgi:hypothetical protein
VGGESTIKSWGYLAWIDAHDGGHKRFPDAALLGCPLIGEQPAITRHDVFVDLDRCPGHIEGPSGTG